MLILASASESRTKLLKNSGINFIQISSNLDESIVKETKVSDLAIELSFSKANRVFENIINDHSEDIFETNSLQILGCDSIFEFKGKAFGKPSSKNEAYKRWLDMSGDYGYLHTGHTILFCGLMRRKNKLFIKKTVKAVISSKVFFSNLKEREIRNYVETLEPLQCAGGFALEGKGGKFIEKINGCFSNVMGLSLPWLREELLKENIFA